MITLVDIVKLVTDNIIGLDKIDKDTKKEYLEAIMRGIAEGAAKGAKENI